MPFIESDEHILIFDWNAGVTPMDALRLDELKRLRDIGIKTIWVHLLWPYFEPTMGQYNFEYIDRILERHRLADLKTVFKAFDVDCDFLPDDYYLRTYDGHVWKSYYDGFRDGWPHSLLSPWNGRAVTYYTNAIRRLRARYESDTVRFIKGGVHGGEVLLPGMIESYYDVSALQSFQSYVRQLYADDLSRLNKEHQYDFPSWETVAPQLLPDRLAMARHPLTIEWLRKSLVEAQIFLQHPFAMAEPHEVWFFLCERDGEYQEAAETGPRSANWLLGEIFQTVPEWLKSSLNILLFEVYRAGGTQGILNRIKGHESVTWVGSEFPQGLRTNTRSAIDSGLRGFLCSPNHASLAKTGMEDWVFDNIKWSLGEWKAARQ